MKRIPYKAYSCTINNNHEVKSEAKKYVLFVSRETSLCRDEMWVSWYINQGCKGFINKPSNNVYEYYVEESSFMLLLQNMLDEMLHDWEEHINSYPQIKKKVINTAQEVAKSIKTKNNKLINSSFLKWVQEGHDYSTYIFGAWSVIYLVEPELIKIFPENIDLIMSLEKPIEFLKMQKSLLEKPIEETILKYGWLNVYSPNDAPYTIEEFQQMKKELNPADIKQQIKLFKKNQKECATFVRSIKDKEIQTKVKMVHAYAWLKTDRVDTWRIAMNHLRIFYDYLTTLVPGMTLQDACNLSVEETIKLLNGIKPDLENIKLRSAHKVIYYYHNNKIEVITDHNLIQDTAKVLEGKVKSNNELKGITACTGKARGRVKIINNSQDLGKIQEGDIFVARYTFPSFTPYMSKAAAIITDEGGLTSHAAIVSRELKKPCIVGVKLATKVLKDGDVVEVNATKGTVRIIKN